MTRHIVRAAAAAVLFTTVAGFAADEKTDKPAVKAGPATAPDWSGYAKVSEVYGKVVTAGEDGFTLRVTWYTTTGGNGGGNRGRSALNSYNRLLNGQTPSRGGGGRNRTPRIQEEHEDYELKFADGGMVRWRKVSDVPGAARKDGFIPPEMQDKLKLPLGTPGYAAEKSHLKAGQIVEVTLVRPREVSAAKVTPADVRVKYAIIQDDEVAPVKDGKDKK